MNKLRLIGGKPRIGIRPIIDGGVAEFVSHWKI